MTKGLVRELVGASLQAAGNCDDAAVEISVVDDKIMRRLNRTHRGIDSTTDVLSFPYDCDFPSVGPQTECPMLGEIVVSAPKVRDQARENGRTVREEFSLMVVHGTLHLLGYDHMTPPEEREMFGLQQDILMGCGII